VIAIVDYGRGNLGSVEKAFVCLGMETMITQNPVVVRNAQALVLPGDGAFHDAMQNLERLELLGPIRECLEAERPFLGICLGYQLLFSESEEWGHSKGLDLIPGVVRRFPKGLQGPDPGSRGSGIVQANPEPPTPNPELLGGRELKGGEPKGGRPQAGREMVPGRELKVPHMGWNQVVHSGDLAIFDGIPSGAYFYFVHSYYPEPLDGTLRVATCQYGVTFSAAIEKGNIFATQFHPEKSQFWGLKLLENFARVVREGWGPAGRAGDGARGPAGRAGDEERRP
jgi:glutamine amidotransferase